MHLCFARPLPRGKILPALAAVFLAALAPTRAQVITAITSGNWSDGATWAGGLVPGAADTASLNAVTLTLGGTVSVGGLAGDAGSTVSSRPVVAARSAPSPSARLCSPSTSPSTSTSPASPATTPSS